MVESNTIEETIYYGIDQLLLGGQVGRLFAVLCSSGSGSSSRFFLRSLVEILGFEDVPVLNMHAFEFSFDVAFCQPGIFGSPL